MSLTINLNSTDGDARVFKVGAPFQLISHGITALTAGLFLPDYLAPVMVQVHLADGKVQRTGASNVAAPPPHHGGAQLLLEAPQGGVERELVVARDHNLVLVRQLGEPGCELSDLGSGQPLESKPKLTSATEPHLVKSPAWTNTSPSGMSILRCGVRLCVSAMHTNRSLVASGGEDGGRTCEGDYCK